MSGPSKVVEDQSRVDEHVKELAQLVHNPRELAAVVAGTSEETAALFNSGHSLARDNTGSGDEG